MHVQIAGAGSAALARLAEGLAPALVLQMRGKVFRIRDGRLLDLLAGGRRLRVFERHANRIDLPALHRRGQQARRMSDRRCGRLPTADASSPGESTTTPMLESPSVTDRSDAPLRSIRDCLRESGRAAARRAAETASHIRRRCAGWPARDARAQPDRRARESDGQARARHLDVSEGKVAISRRYAWSVADSEASDSNFLTTCESYHRI